MRGSWHLGQRGHSILVKQVDGMGLYSDIALPCTRRERYRTLCHRKLPRARAAITRSSHRWRGLLWSILLILKIKRTVGSNRMCCPCQSQGPGSRHGLRVHRDGVWAPRNGVALSGPRPGVLSANARRPARPAFVRIALEPSKSPGLRSPRERTDSRILA
jgi:hypothetical protein